MSDTQVLIPRNVLQDVLDYCGPHVERDGLLPAFSSIHFYEQGMNLHATATDRYSLIDMNTRLGVPSETQFSLSVPQVRMILSTCRAARRSQVVLEFTLSEEEVTVALADGFLVGLSSVSLTLRAQGTGDYQPKSNSIRMTKKLFEEPLASSPRAVNSKFLTRIPKGQECAIRQTSGMVGAVGHDWVMLVAALRANVATFTGGR